MTSFDAPASPTAATTKPNLTLFTFVDWSEQSQESFDRESFTSLNPGARLDGTAITFLPQKIVKRLNMQEEVSLWPASYVGNLFNIDRLQEANDNGDLLSTRQKGLLQLLINNKSFDKRYIVIPACFANHWILLLIVQEEGDVGAFYVADSIADDAVSKNKPIIEANLAILNVIQND